MTTKQERNIKSISNAMDDMRFARVREIIKKETNNKNKKQLIDTAYPLLDENDNPEMMSFFLDEIIKHKISVNKNDFLYQSVIVGNYDVVKYMLKNGANPNTK